MEHIELAKLCEDLREKTASCNHGCGKYRHQALRKIVSEIVIQNWRKFSYLAQPLIEAMLHSIFRCHTSRAGGRGLISQRLAENLARPFQPAHDSDPPSGSEYQFTHNPYLHQLEAWKL